MLGDSASHILTLFLFCFAGVGATGSSSDMTECSESVDERHVSPLNVTALIVLKLTTAKLETCSRVQLDKITEGIR